MKRIVAAILLFLFMFGICSCKSKQDEEIAVSASENKNNDSKETTEQSKPETDALSQSESANDKEENIKQDSKDIETNDTDINAQKPSDDITTDTEQSENKDFPGISEQASSAGKVTEEDKNTASVSDVQNPSVNNNKTKRDKTHAILKIDTEPSTPLETTADLKHYTSADVFVGKIISKEEVISKNNTYNANKTASQKVTGYFLIDSDIEDVYFSLTGDLYLYTVEVNTTINSVFVEKGTTIKVIADASAVSEPYEIGGSYLMYGVLYEYHGETVLALTQMFAAKVDDSGTLYGIGLDAKIINDFKNTDTLFADETIQEIFKKDLNIPSKYKEDYGIIRGEDLSSKKTKLHLKISLPTVKRR